MFTNTQSGLTEDTEDLIHEHTVGVKDPDDLIPHLPCHVLNVQGNIFFHLTDFNGVNEDGMWVYSGSIYGIPSSHIELDPSTDTLFLLDSDPETFMPKAKSPFN